MLTAISKEKSVVRMFGREFSYDVEHGFHIRTTWTFRFGRSTSGKVSVIIMGKSSRRSHSSTKVHERGRATRSRGTPRDWNDKILGGRTEWSKAVEVRRTGFAWQFGIWSEILLKWCILRYAKYIISTEFRSTIKERKYLRWFFCRSPKIFDRDQLWKTLKNKKRNRAFYFFSVFHNWSSTYFLSVI